MSHYTIHYNHPTLGKVFDPMPEGWGIGNVREGFWVGELGGINPPIENNSYWIPPSGIHYVKAVREN